MKKVKATIYIPIGFVNSELNADAKVVKLVHKNLPRELKVVSILDTYLDESYSACTVELEEVDSRVLEYVNNIQDNNSDVFQVSNFISENIKSVKNRAVKKELKKILDFINKLSADDSK